MGGRTCSAGTCIGGGTGGSGSGGSGSGGNSGNSGSGGGGSCPTPEEENFSFFLISHEAVLRISQLPDGFEFTGLEVIEEVSRNARNILLTLLLVCGYCALTISTTGDAAILTNSVASPLPILGTSVPIAEFYLAAPLLDCPAPAGVVIGSGVMTERRQEVVDAFAAAGGEIGEVVSAGDWVTLVVRPGIAGPRSGA